VVASVGGAVWVSVTTRSVMHDPSDGMREGVSYRAGGCRNCLHEAFLPAPHTGLRLAGPAHDLIGANTVRAQKDDLSRQTCLCGVLRSRASAFRRRRSAGLRVMEISGSHAPDSHAFRSLGIPSGIQMSDAIH